MRGRFLIGWVRSLTGSRERVGHHPNRISEPCRIGFLVGLGLGSLTGQRTTSTIVLEIIVTPILAGHVIPYFLDGQRLVVGIAMDHLRPEGLAAGAFGPAGPGRLLFGGRGALGIPPMPTWAMISLIVGWIIGWSVIGAWQMITRDA